MQQQQNVNNVNNNNSSLQQQAESDLASLKRVSHRLALTKPENLGNVLDKLLPRLIQRLAENHPKVAAATAAQGDLKKVYNDIHLTLMEMLSHAMKRVRQDSTVKLPCLGLLQLLNDNPNSPLIWNFGLTFLTMGMPRCSCGSDDVYPLLPILIQLTASKNSQLSSLTNPMHKKQASQLAHLLLRAIPLMLVQPSTNTNTNTSTSTTTKQSSDSNDTNNNEKYLNETRELLGKSEISQPIFDLLLDVLLYQPTAGTIPPPGVSAWGQERLRDGNSTIEKDWGCEMAVNSSRLNQLKLDILNIIAPSRKVFLFTHNKLIPIVLLVIASGDGTSVQVSDHATTLLRIYLDSFRGGGGGSGSGSGNNNGGGSSSSPSETPSSSTTTATASEAYGNPIQLLKELFVLSLGQTRADSFLSNNTSSDDIPSLGVSFVAPSTTTTTPGVNNVSQVILSTKRRPLSENGLAVVYEFCTKLLEEVPMIFEQLQQKKQDSASSSIQQVRSISNLLVASISKTLGGSLTSSASGLNKTRGRPYVGAAQLLNTYVVRLCVYYDARYQVDGNNMEDSISKLRALLGQTLQCACQSISPVTLQKVVTNTTTSAGNIAIRDACYGTICTLARSKFAFAKEYYLFAVGKRSDNFATETATLLFKCTTNETETLRPRVVAALDALLGAHARVFVPDTSSSPPTSPHSPGEQQSDVANDSDDVPGAVVNNPWMTTTTPSTASAKEAGGTAQLATNNNGSMVAVEARTLCQSLLPLLWNASQPYQTKASRVAAARWSSDLIHKLDLCRGAHILCYLAGDSDVTAANVAREGLGFLDGGSASANNNTQSTEHPNAPTSFEVPNFSDFVDTVYGQDHVQQKDSTPTFWDFPSAQGRAAVLRYTLLCLLADLYGGEEYAIDIYVKALTTTLRSFLETEQRNSKASDLLDEAAICLNTLLGSSQFARKQLVASAHAGMGQNEIESLAVSARSSKARRHFAACFGKLCEDVSLWVGQHEEGSADNILMQWIQSSGIQNALLASLERFNGLKNNHYSTGQIHGTAYLSAQCVKAIRKLRSTIESSSSTSSCDWNWNSAGSLLSSMSTSLTHSDEVIGNACADSLCIAFAYDSVDSPLLDPSLAQPLSSILGNISTALKKFGHGDHTDPTRAFRIARAAGSCLAASVACDTNSIPETATASIADARRKCVQGLFNLQSSDVMRKDEEILLVVGEAFADYADSYSPNNGDCWQDAGAWPETFDEAFQNKLAPHDEILYVILKKCMTVSNPRVRTSTALLLLAVVARAARRINQNKDLASRALVKSILEHLFEVQGAFITLLADPKSTQIQRESCCLGLAACRSISSLLLNGDDAQNKRDELNSHLLRAFGQTTNYGSSAMIETREQASERRRAEGIEEGQAAESAEQPRSEVGGVSGMSEAALGAYREMATASVSLGRSDILYALLMMSVSHSIWFLEGYRDRYNAASLLGENSFLGNRTNTAEMREALQPHLGKLVPRLLRACNDPNKQTREQMVFLWTGITGGGSEARSIITKHFLTTFDSLVQDASSKLWRARVGACGALAEIIVGRDWDDLGGGNAVLDDDDIHTSSNVSAGVRLLRLWRLSCRAIDDVREAVRENGERLGRATRSLTLRLCDPSLVDGSGSKRCREEQLHSKQSSSAAAATSLRWLIKHGLSQQCPEAAGICLSALVEVVGAVSPTMLSPILGDLLHSLLLAMSGMEPAALNYLQLRTNDQEGLERARLQLSQVGPLASAVNKCLEAVPSVNIEAQRSIVSKLDSALRLSIGFATRAATADATSQLCSTCPSAFQFPGAFGAANPSVQLMRGIYFAMEREQGQATKDKLCHSFGNIAALCPGKSVRSLAAKACRRYNASCGNNYDPASRRASALALRAIAVRASEQFADGGPSDIWLRIVLPAAYLGKKDPDEKIASLWGEVWDEGGSVASNSNRLAYSRLEEKILPELVEMSVAALEDVAWSRRVAAASALFDLSNVMEPTNVFSHSVRRAEAASRAIGGCLHLLMRPRLWDGKNQVVVALVALVASWSCGSKVEWSNDDFTLPVDTRSDQTDLFVGDSYFSSSDDIAISTFDVEMDVEQSDPAGPVTDTNFSDVENDEEEKMEIEAENGETKASLPVLLEGVCRWLVTEALTKAAGGESLSEELLPYRQACLKGFCKLSDNRKSLFTLLSPILSKSLKNEKEKPVIVARILEVLGHTWYDGFDNVDEWETLLTVSPVQPWTVRVATCECMTRLLTKVDKTVLQKLSFVGWTVNNVQQATRDLKYWKSREAGLILLEGLVNRANADVTILEAVLPHKEDMMKLLRKCLADSQHKVTAKSSAIIQSASQWP